MGILGIVRGKQLKSLDIELCLHVIKNILNTSFLLKLLANMYIKNDGLMLFFFLKTLSVAFWNTQMLGWLSKIIFKEFTLCLQLIQIQ